MQIFIEHIKQRQEAIDAITILTLNGVVSPEISHRELALLEDQIAILKRMQAKAHAVSKSN